MKKNEKKAAKPEEKKTAKKPAKPAAEKPAKPAAEKAVRTGAGGPAKIPLAWRCRRPGSHWRPENALAVSALIAMRHRSKP